MEHILSAPPPVLQPPAPPLQLPAPPWKASPGLKPPSQASLNTLQQYCQALGLSYTSKDIKAVLRQKIDLWKSGQKTTKEKVLAARKPAPRAPRPKTKKRIVPIPSSTSSQSPQTPARSTQFRPAPSSTSPPNTLQGSDELGRQVDEILGEALEEDIANIANDTSVLTQQIIDENPLEDFDEEGGEEGGHSQGIPLMERGVAKLLRVESAIYGDAEGLDPNQEMLALVNHEIQQGRRIGAIRTEHGVLKPFAKWIDEQIEAGVLKDDIVDESTAIRYLRYSATRPLLDSHGRLKDGKGQLSASSIKKIGTMLNRVRKAQVVDANVLNIDLDKTRPLNGVTLVKLINHLKIKASQHARTVVARDVTAGTILEYGCWGVREMKQLLQSVFAGTCTPTVIRTSFFLSFTTQSLMRSDDLRSLKFPYLQPWVFRKGKNVDRDLFCLVALSHDGKTLSHKPADQPLYTFLIPHKEPELCAIGHLAAHLQYLFDQIHWHENVNDSGVEWDWNDDASFRNVCLLPGKGSAEKPAAASAIAKQIEKNLKDCNLTSKNKAHLGRKMGCVLMETNGAKEHAIERHGHWESNVFSSTYETKLSRDACITSAGFELDQPVVNYRIRVEIPAELEEQVFPFVEGILGSQRIENPLSQGTKSTLHLLLYLRRYFILHYAAVYAHTPNAVVFRTLDLFKGAANPFITWFRECYPILLEEEKVKSGEIGRHLAGIADQDLRDTLAIIKRTVDQMHDDNSARFDVIDRRTSQFSPSKRQRTDGFNFSSSPSSSTSSSPAPRIFDPRLPSCWPNNPEPRSPSSTPPPPPPPAAARLPPVLRNTSSAPPPISSSPALLPSPEINSPQSRATSPTAYTLPRPVATTTVAPVVNATRQGAPPSTPPRPRNSPSPEEPSPHRLVILGTPTIYDFILPHNPLAFATSLTDTPTLPNFPSPASFAVIFDAVKQPPYLFETYGPKNPGQYKDVYEMLKHWEEGIVGDGAKGVKAMLPAIKDIEARFSKGVKGTGMNQWALKLSDSSRQRLVSMRLFANSVQLHAQQTQTTSRGALDSLIRTSLLAPTDCAKFVTYLKSTKPKPAK